MRFSARRNCPRERWGWRVIYCIWVFKYLGYCSQILYNSTIAFSILSVFTKRRHKFHFLTFITNLLYLIRWRFTPVVAKSLRGSLFLDTRVVTVSSRQKNGSLRLPQRNLTRYGGRETVFVFGESRGSSITPLLSSLIICCHDLLFCWLRAATTFCPDRRTMTSRSRKSAVVPPPPRYIWFWRQHRPDRLAVWCHSLRTRRGLLTRLNYWSAANARRMSSHF